MMKVDFFAKFLIHEAICFVTYLLFPSRRLSCLVNYSTPLRECTSGVTQEAGYASLSKSSIHSGCFLENAFIASFIWFLVSQTQAQSISSRADPQLRECRFLIFAKRHFKSSHRFFIVLLQGHNCWSVLF